MKYHEAGKGSAPRKYQDHGSYSSGWDRIFGKNNGKDKKTEKDPAETSPYTKAIKTPEENKRDL